MSDSAVHNLLKGTGKTVDNDRYNVVSYELVEPLVVGRKYTVSAYVEDLVRIPLPSGVDRPALALYDGGFWWSGGSLSGDVPGVQTLTFTYTQPFPDHADPDQICLFNTPQNGTGVTRRARFRDVMLVAGDTPAAWAPAEGETLAGGGALMSANLWKAENVIPAEALEDGIYACSGTRGVRTNVALDRLAENQTFHCGFSVNPGANDKFSMALCYRDAAGYVNYAFSTDTSAPAGKWTRVSGSVVVPSGMTVYQMVICNNNNASGSSGWKVMNPTLSLGSPVCLASSAHTPYATQDHVSVTYATKASLKVTDESVKAEVSARAQTDRNVADLSSRLTQTANSLTTEISDRRSAITTVTGLANAAQSTADAAKTSASSAVSTANAASSTASAAKSTAQTAASDAATAKTNASSAKSTAQTAASDAATAKTNASAAVSTANSANTKSESAVSTANSAVSTANAAQSTADNAAKQANLYIIGLGDAGAVAKWIHLGTLTSAGDSSSATIAIVFGNGYNGSAGQNSTLTITIKDGWQSTPSAVNACGVTVMRENCDNALVDVLAQSATVYDVWVYVPWAHSEGRYSISGDYAAWQHSGATQKDEPATSATQVKQDVAYRLADATKAQTMATENRSSIKQLSDSITAEVTARTKTDGMVSDLSSRLTQTADGFNASIDRLSDTDKKVNAWFDFEADSSGNPQLKMGSSTSPVVGVYTNAGLAYRSRDGATIMELDASRSATISDHMEAQDMKLGKWKWVQTQGGTHLTLVWAG